MILDLLINQDQEIPADFSKQFSKINLIKINPKSPLETQVSKIEEVLGKPTIEKMLIYSKKYNSLGTILSRRYINSAKLSTGPLKLGNTALSPDHVSKIPSKKRRNRILFLAPHFDEAYIGAILPHKVIGDRVFLQTFTFPEKERHRIERAYSILGLEKDDYSLGALCVNNLFRAKKTIRTTLENLLDQFNPTVVFSVFPKGANFDHIAVAQVAKDIVMTQSKADLIYGYVLQSRKINPIIFPIFSEPICEKILDAFGRNGFGKIFETYMLYLKHYMQTLSEPLFRMASKPGIDRFGSFPLEAERIANYRIPNLL
ncbi:hypothetical protein E2P61_02650 [Candidatus Bathyarchaeota archaeon]|nr:hypothetical protein E2P61_02650 [Candidatus Bathyarchaeota archaeon]